MPTNQQIYSGYTGLYKQPYANASTYGDTVYFVLDALQQEANVIVLTPGAYRDIYRMVSAPTIQYVNLFVPSMDVLWVSDIFRLVTDLMKIKKEVNLYYPDSISVGLTNALFKISCKKYTAFSSKRIPEMRVMYEKSFGSRDDHVFYDIHMWDGTKHHLFTLYVDKDNFKTIMSQSGVDTTHMPYNTVFYGGLTAPECAAIDKYAMRHVVVNNFACREEFIFAAESGLFDVPKRIVL